MSIISQSTIQTVLQDTRRDYLDGAGEIPAELRVAPLPGWWKVVWVIACLALMVFLPSLLEKILDPINARLIRAYCAKAGATKVEVQPFPNHYGVHF